MNYKIRIECTNEKDLSLNGKKINKKSDVSQLTNQFDLEKAIVVSREIVVPRKKFVLKTFECLFNRKLTEIELIEFVRQMKKSGFSSAQNVRVDFINATNNEYLHSIRFNTEEQFKPRIQPRTHKYKYNSEIIYSKK